MRYRDESDESALLSFRSFRARGRGPGRISTFVAVVAIGSVLAPGVLACASAGSRGRDPTSVRVLRPGEPETAAPRSGQVLEGTNNELASGQGSPVGAGVVTHRESPPNQVHVHAPPKMHLVAPPPAQGEPLDQWSARWPEPSRLLAGFFHAYPDVAGRLVDLDQTRATTSVLTEWAITHRFEDVNAFLLNRSGWESLRALLDHGGRTGVDAYLAWTRQCPDAAAELVAHPEGFAWAAAHVVPPAHHVAVHTR